MLHKCLPPTPTFSSCSPSSSVCKSPASLFLFLFQFSIPIPTLPDSYEHTLCTPSPTPTRHRFLPLECHWPHLLGLKDPSHLTLSPVACESGLWTSTTLLLLLSSSLSPIYACPICVSFLLFFLIHLVRLRSNGNRRVKRPRKKYRVSPCASRPVADHHNLALALTRTYRQPGSQAEACRQVPHHQTRQTNRWLALRLRLAFSTYGTRIAPPISLALASIYKARNDSCRSQIDAPPALFSPSLRLRH